jgi:hypothetical protein
MLLAEWYCCQHWVMCERGKELKYHNQNVNEAEIASSPKLWGWQEGPGVICGWGQHKSTLLENSGERQVTSQRAGHGRNLAITSLTHENIEDPNSVTLQENQTHLIWCQVHLLI